MQNLELTGELVQLQAINGHGEFQPILDLHLPSLIANYGSFQTPMVIKAVDPVDSERNCKPQCCGGGCHAKTEENLQTTVRGLLEEMGFPFHQDGHVILLEGLDPEDFARVRRAILRAISGEPAPEPEEATNVNMEAPDLEATVDEDDAITPSIEFIDSFVDICQTITVSLVRLNQRAAAKRLVDCMDNMIGALMKSVEIVNEKS
jgi:hypothetical protein